MKLSIAEEPALTFNFVIQLIFDWKINGYDDKYPRIDTKDQDLK